MTCKKLIEYLRGYDEDEIVACVVLNPDRKCVQKVKAMYVIDEAPCIAIVVSDAEVGKEDFEETEEYEQLHMEEQSEA